MTVHTMRLKPTPFAMIASGQKTVELRLNDEKRRLVSVGDEIIFSRTDREAILRCRVIALHPFSSFAELYRAFPPTVLGYTAEESDSASPTDMDAYYSKEEQAKYGVLGIEIVKLS